MPPLALDGLSDQKQFGTVAKSSPHDTVRTAALGKIHDAKVLAQRGAPRRRRPDRARGGGARDRTRRSS